MKRLGELFMGIGGTMVIVAICFAYAAIAGPFYYLIGLGALAGFCLRYDALHAKRHQKLSA